MGSRRSYIPPDAARARGLRDLGPDDELALNYLIAAKKAARPWKRNEGVTDPDDVEQVCWWGMYTGLKQYDPAKAKGTTRASNGYRYARYYAQTHFLYERNRGMTPVREHLFPLPLNPGYAKLIPGHAEVSSWEEEDWERFLRPLTPREKAVVRFVCDNGPDFRLLARFTGHKTRQVANAYYRRIVGRLKRYWTSRLNIRESLGIGE